MIYIKVLQNFIFITIVAIVCGILSTDAAATHKHVVHQVSRERMEDGGYSPRDAHHHEGGEHHSEFDHEAILGSVKEAEEFDALSPEESKRRLSILVLKMDLNNDMYIDRHELKAWILRSFKTLSEEEAADRFEEIDDNTDDKISWEEYIQNVYDIEDESAEKDILQYPHLEEEKKLMADDKEMFHRADANKNGYLDPDEFIKFQSPEEHPEMLPLILQQTLRDKDINGDGQIDFKEFIGDAAKNHDKEWLVVEKEKFDNDFDINQDGYLRESEILSWVVPSNEEVAEEEVNHLFVSADVNHDNSLSYQEIIDNYEIFVGSEATDYGDHLQNIDHFTDEL